MQKIKLIKEVNNQSPAGCPYVPARRLASKYLSLFHKTLFKMPLIVLGRFCVYVHNDKKNRIFFWNFYRPKH